jgi:D-alanyl-D-alanine carboxypeptidase (penicillin-binding protein 5/6)
MKNKRQHIIIATVLIALFLFVVTRIEKNYIATPGDSKDKKELADSVKLPSKGRQDTVEVSSNARLAEAISADAAIVVDQTNGKVLFEKNADRMEYPASMTKMMTCVLAVESGKLDSIVTISPTASAASDTYLTSGDRIKLSNLLYMLMLQSNNGSAVAVAEFLSTPHDNFIARMNRKAQQLGMTHTHFVTPNGMHDPNHYSTARDMAKLALYCMRNSQFREFVKEEQLRVRYKYPAGKNIHCRNENKLLSLYDGVNGIKTGYTDIALGCLASSYERNGLRLIAVVMHSRRGQLRFYDSMKLLDWTRAQFGK